MRGDCVVTVDIPPLPDQRVAPLTEQASMRDIKRAAAAVLLACVGGADHLGGFVFTGRRARLQVRVESSEDAKGPAMAIAKA